MNEPVPIHEYRQDRAQDEAFMRQALALAAGGLGRCAPNPSVGCVIVKNGQVVGRARSADGGRPHAEPQALDMAGPQAKGATVYATLEPCGHHGRTPPCVDALIAAQVGRVVMACRDPSQTGNDCVEKLEAAGIAVTTGVCEDEGRAVNEGFFTVLAQGRPFVTAKVATTLDGRIATKTGASKWITGDKARARGHEFRAAHDAVLAGIGTVLADDPQLTVRLPGTDRQPVRIIIDRDMNTPPDSKLAQSAAEHDVWLIGSAAADADRRKRLHDAGIQVLEAGARDDGHFDVEEVLKMLAGKGLTRLFVEGGGYTVTEFMRAGMLDRLLWFRAPKLIGGDGVPAFQALGVETMDDVLDFELEDREQLGEDFLEIWRRKQ